MLISTIYFQGEDGCHREDQTEDSEKKKISNCQLFLIMSENNLHNLQLCTCNVC